MAQGLRVLVAFSEDLGSISSTWLIAVSNSGSRGPVHLSGFHELQAHKVCTDIQVG